MGGRISLKSANVAIRSIITTGTIGPVCRARDLMKSTGCGNFISAVVISIGLLLAFNSKATAAVNVFFSNTAPTSLQGDFIAMTTNQFLGALSQSPFQLNTYSLTITGKRPNPPMTTCPPPSSIDTQLAIATATLAALSTDYYLNGWVNGQAYERYKNVSLLSGFAVSCATTSFPAPPGVATSTWVVPKLDSTTCSFVMGYAANYVYSQNFSSPTIVPGF